MAGPVCIIKSGTVVGPSSSSGGSSFVLSNQGLSSLPLQAVAGPVLYYKIRDCRRSLFKQWRVQFCIIKSGTVVGPSSSSGGSSFVLYNQGLSELPLQAVADPVLGKGGGVLI